MNDWHDKLVKLGLAAFTFACALLVLAFAFKIFTGAASAEPYLLLQGARLSCDQVSNHNHIECDSNEGYELALEGGYAIPVIDGLEAWLGAQAFHHWQDQHGWNKGRGKDDNQQFTADGETIRITGLRAAATGVLGLWGPISVFAGVACRPGRFRYQQGYKARGRGTDEGRPADRLWERSASVRLSGLGHDQDSDRRRSAQQADWAWIHAWSWMEVLIMTINYTWPGRFHLIWKRGLFYITLWLPSFDTWWRWRLHYCRAAPIVMDFPGRSGIEPRITNNG